MSDAKVRTKKADGLKKSIGVKFLGFSCKILPFLGIFPPKNVNFLGFFGIFWDFARYLNKSFVFFAIRR